MRRSQAYKWLGKALRLPPHLSHIGMLTLDQCSALLVRLNSKWAEIKPPVASPSQLPRFVDSEDVEHWQQRDDCCEF